jgi:maleylpyruvate isomerase
MKLHGYFRCSVSCVGRFGGDLTAYPRLLKAEAAAKNLKAFADAAPDRQPDAE